ncbi:MAG: hypothetical protein VX438_12905, partial [Planctomycetota bacterium]|nr:hypothetical protein [Planctomycetota bacterium]
LTGMIDNESDNGISLKQEKNKVTNLARSEIEAIKNSRLSLMPSGLEKEITVDQMADLLEFLMNAN